MSHELRYYEAINEALAEEMERDERVILFGTDVGKAGHVFVATKGLQQRFGPHRVRDTPISELGMVGAAVGAAMAGMRPVVDVLFMDFLPLALDQLLNQASKIRYMTAGGFHVPMTLLTLCGAGKENGPQHSQNLEAWLGGIPGITVAMPTRSTPSSLRKRIVAAATNPPVFPGEISASARPSLIRLTAFRIEQSRFLRNPSTGLSSIVSTSEAWMVCTRGSWKLNVVSASEIIA